MKRILLKILIPLTMLLCCLGFAACGTPDNLSAPENLRLEGGVLLWDEVEYADGYAVYIDGEEHFTAECRYDVSNLNEAEIHTLEVRAYTNGGIQSPYVDMTYTGKYAIPTQGLEFRYSDTKDPYFVVEKLAVDENGWCIIPATYEGVPVTRLWSSSTSESILAQIRSLYLPNCIRDYDLTGSGIYSYLPNLENIVLGEGNERFISDGNCLIEKATNTLVVGCINGQIPDYVTKIGDEAFRGRNLKDITVPDTISEIGSWAFANCEALEKVVFSENSALTKLQYNTFAGCSALTEVNIPEGVTTLSYTFSGCSSLKTVTLPESVKSMYHTFDGCTSLKSVNIPAGVTSLAGTFRGCTSLESFTVPGTVKNLTYDTFLNCTSLKQITLEEGVEGIGSFWLSDGNGAFGNCASLTEVSLPSTLKEIESKAFQLCISLESVVIPDSVTRLESSCFENCTSLKSVVLPKGIVIENSVFKNCPIEEVYYRGTEEEWDENMTRIHYSDTVLLSATRYYYSENPPTEKGNYWRFVGDVPTKWA